MKDLTDYYSTVGYLRATGLDEARAYQQAEDAMTTFNVTILRRSAMTISFQADSYNEAVRKSAETISGWRHDYDPIQRIFISELDKTLDLLEYRPEEVVELRRTL